MDRIVVSRETGRRHPRGRRRGLLALVLLAGVAACESTTSPGSLVELDTEAALADYEALARVLSTQGFAGFQALEGRTPFGPSSAVAAVAGLDGARAGDDHRGFALRLLKDLQASDAPVGGALAAPVLSGRYLGKTFVYDRTLDEYVVDPDRTGAPATGVRFVLYEVDGLGRPRSGREIGYADLLDEGAGSASDVQLRWIAVESGKTILDYRTSVDESAAQDRITVDGFVVDDGARLDFSIDLKGRTSAGKTLLDMNFDLRVDSRDFRVTGEVRDVEEGNDDGGGSIVLAVKHQAHALRVEMAGSGGTVDGRIFVDGGLFATITGDADHPDVKGASGDPITAGEAVVVLTVVKIVDDVFDLLEDLLEPVHQLLVLGWIL